MSALTKREAFSAVFAAEDPTAGPFRRRVSDRGLIFPIPDFRLPARVALAVASVASSECYLVFVGASAPERVGQYAPKMVDLQDYAGYRDESSSPLPQALVAVDGSWGGIFADDGFGLLGGTAGFLAALMSSDRTLDFDKQEDAFCREFAKDRERLGPGNWVDRVLAHVHE